MYIVIFILALLLLVLYPYMFYAFSKMWKLAPEEKTDQAYIPTKSVSIIIAARNEEKNIARLLHTLSVQNYPTSLVEILVIDDESEDATASIVQTFKNVQYHFFSVQKDKNNKAYKKQCIEFGITKSKHDIIITTDADCIMQENWLRAMMYAFETRHKKVIAGPVAFLSNNSIFQIFQQLDFATMQMITGALLFSKKGIMGNGANLLYEKKAFEEVNGFEGIKEYASGDDMMLMKKIEMKYPQAISYLKNSDAIVMTNPTSSFKEFLQQRIRWASKNKGLEDKNIKWTLAFVWLCNFLFLLSFVFLFHSSWYIKLVPIIFISFKALHEDSACKSTFRFFNLQHRCVFIYLLQIPHIIYMVSIGFFSLFTSYQWKGRRLK